MSVQERFDAALEAMAAADDPEYDIDPLADFIRIGRDGDTYSWGELPEHVRDYWREIAADAQREAEAARAATSPSPEPPE